MTFFLKSLAFIRRDFIIDSSYKIAFIQRQLYTIVPIILIFFVSKLTKDSASLHLSKYGGAYFPFAVIGICLSNFFNIALSTFKSSIRRAQMTGCLEAILNSQTSTKSIILMSSVYSFLVASLNLIIAGIAILFFHFDYSQSNLIGSLVVIVISIFVFVSLGIISSALIFYYKQGDPLGFILGTLSALLGGAFFPISILPLWLQKVAAFIPIKYTLDAVRLTLLKGYSLKMVSYEIIVLSCLALILFPLSLIFVQYTIRKGKKDGSISQY